MRYQVFFGREQIKQDAVQHITSGTRIIFYQYIFQIRQFLVYLFMPLPEDGNLILRLFFAFHQITHIRENRFLFIRHVFMNLDKSLPEQYALYLGGLVHGDFGYSYSYRQDVLPLITSRIPNTLTLTLTALLFAFIIGTSVGIIAALKQNTIFDYIVMVITLVGVSMPIFWLALMLVLQFSVKMNLLPVMGMGDLSKGFGDVVIHMILPGFCLATIPMATFARTMRSSMIDIMSSDYIRCLRARGIKKLKVILIHGLKNALPPLITVLGLQIAGTFTGAIITEGIFSWPGMGTMINTAINNRDYSLIQGAVLFSAIMFVFCNMLVDIAYAILNPKVKLEKG